MFDHIVGTGTPNQEAELLRDRAGFDDWARDVVAALELRRQSVEAEQPDGARRLSALTAFLHH